jgi:hypothetical protein
MMKKNTFTNGTKYDKPIGKPVMFELHCSCPGIRDGTYLIARALARVAVVGVRRQGAEVTRLQEPDKGRRRRRNGRETFVACVFR